MAVSPTVLGRVATGASIRISGHRASAKKRTFEIASSTGSVGPTDPPAAATSQFESFLATASDLDLLVTATAEPRDRAAADRAFAELYKRYKNDVYTYCLRMMGRDADRASDLFQDVFIRAYERADQFRSGSNVRGWLYTIARNLCLNALRCRQAVDSLELHPMLASRDRSLAPEYDEEQHFLRDRIENAVATLPEEFREAFVLREFDGFSYAQIAQMTGTSLSVTKVRIWRAKEKLRTLLQPYLAE
ncbi:MAG: sigma-70 family RNA polymerase sigma factor [Bacteroidota bacterium]|nr:sigma-70 family RNA polymerase sigma factor [Bacteroidota bacterium]MDP4232578.1 sigma-70 family RNA polymerase sigma factor [Bacteroidota bacterium]MDP4242968.1 sigma-70 family RNA polymerase sigma factor [Bacteroidota bacterium]MDP4286457.1 sigma-70 family RNA polymerase sigma factor [Bacteroidota bacterium]